MQKGKFKRTAGQRRYLALLKKVKEARYNLMWAQDHIRDKTQTLTGVNDAYVMQKITEAKEGLK